MMSVFLLVPLLVGVAWALRWLLNHEGPSVRITSAWLTDEQRAREQQVFRSVAAARTLED